MEFKTKVEVNDWDSTGVMKKGTAVVKWSVEFISEDDGISEVNVYIPDQIIDCQWDCVGIDDNPYHLNQDVDVDDCHVHLNDSFIPDGQHMFMRPECLEYHNATWALIF